MRKLAPYNGPSLLIGIPQGLPESQSEPRQAVVASAGFLLKASISQLQTWREDGVRTFSVKSPDHAFAAAKVFMRLRGLGFNVFIEDFSLIRPETPLVQLEDELDALFQCGWSYLPFLLPKSKSGFGTEELESFVDLLEMLRPVAKMEAKTVQTCWHKDIWTWSSQKGISGLRSALRVIESENRHVFRMGIVRTKNRSWRSKDLFQIAVRKIYERRPEQLKMVQKLLGAWERESR